MRLQLQEVQASRVRIVEAGYEERRRLERDLHDGAQQRLVSLGLQIRRMQRSLPREASMLAPALDQIVDEVGSAIGDLRQIAAGVRPARLDDGLAAALHDLARTAPDPGRGRGADRPRRRERRGGRLLRRLRGAHERRQARLGHAHRADARRVRTGTLCVSVVRRRRRRRHARAAAPGLAGLGDRVSAHGGTLAIASPRGGGTRIEVAIPCES